MDVYQKAILDTVDRREGYRYFRRHVIDFYDANFGHNYSAEELNKMTFFKLGAGLFNVKNRAEFCVVCPDTESEAFHQGMRNAREEFQDVINYLKTRTADANKLKMEW